MIVSEAVNILKHAELKQLAVKDEETALVSYINLGVTELHKRFDLWEEKATITMVDGTNKYTLDSTDVNVDIDEDDHEFLMVMMILDKDGEEIKVNNDDSDYGVTVPRFNTLKVKNPVAGDTLEVAYRAAPKFLIDHDDKIQLPVQFMEALFHYVGYRAHGSVNGDMKSENNTHYLRFDQSCKRIIAEGLKNDDSMEVSKLESRGFV